MAYQTFPNKPELHIGDLADPEQMNAAFDGIQVELEDRSAAAWLDGVVAGLTPSINGSAVDIASGQAYVVGLLFTGGTSVAFESEDPPGTYYVYIDSGNLQSPYAKSVARPGAGKLVVCTVAWDGSSLSNLVDMRPWGISPAALHFDLPAQVTEGPMGHAILDRDFWIEDVQVMLADTGSEGSTIVDVHVGNAGEMPTTIFSDQSRRPEVASTEPDYSVATSGVPDTNRKASAGQVLEVDVDSAATGAAGLAVVVRGRYC
jgi:hypothetical protein